MELLSMINCQYFLLSCPTIPRQACVYALYQPHVGMINVKRLSRSSNLTYSLPALNEI